MANAIAFVISFVISINDEFFLFGELNELDVDALDLRRRAMSYRWRNIGLQSDGPLGTISLEDTPSFIDGSSQRTWIRSPSKRDPQHDPAHKQGTEDYGHTDNDDHASHASSRFCPMNVTGTDNAAGCVQTT